MKMVQIGTVGHYAYALPTAKKYGMDFAGICTACPEDLWTMQKKRLNDMDFPQRPMKIGGKCLLIHVRMLQWSIR